MKITLLGIESMGVRGLSCLVEVDDRKIVIDPGMALGYRRSKLLPHPAQVAVGEQVRKKILAALTQATDVVFSHYHGDHVPLLNPNPYQIDASKAAPLFQKARLWAKGSEDLSAPMVARKEGLMRLLGVEIISAEEKIDDVLAFSPPVPHGEPNSRLGTVMMTYIRDDHGSFVHASDIQLLDEKAVALILDWRPNIVLIGGPPLYLSGFMDRNRRRKSWDLAQSLAQGVETMIIDHHLMRCEEGLVWLDRLSSKVNTRVTCGADFMRQPRRLLEARRIELYEQMPVPKDWHKRYALGVEDTHRFQKFLD